MEEIWLPLFEFEHKYQVSNFGRVKHVNSDKNRVLAKDTCGYSCVTLRTKGYGQKTVLVHRAVAIAFIKNEDESLNEINHIDGNKSNNKVENLEWSNRKLNIQHSFDTGLQISLKGEQIGNSKLKEKDVFKIRTMLECGKSQTKIAKEYNVKQSTISSIKLRKIWKHI